MDSIIKATFPDDPLETTSDLVNLGERLGYNMPDLSVVPQVRYDELVKAPKHAQTFPTNGVNSDPGTSAGSQERETSTEGGSGRISNAAARLVRDPSGNEHYIGPSGSLSFFAELRDLISSYHRNGQYDTSSSTFALDNVAKALEPDQEEQKLEDNADGRDLNNYNIASPTSIISTTSNNTTGLAPPDLDEVLKSLPPREEMEILIASYFDNIHVDFPLFHRATFQDEYEIFVLQARNARTRAQTSASVSVPLEHQVSTRPDWGWLVCLNVILVFGSFSNSKSTLSDYPKLRRSCISTSYSLLPHVTTRCALSNVQALLLLSLYFHNNNDRNAAWTVVGTATRVAFAIGLHQADLDSLFRPIEREIRKRVWCTLFTFEQFLCSTLGRPSGISDPEVNVRVPTDGLLDDGNGSGLGFAEESLKLSCILAAARQISEPRLQKHSRSTSSRSLSKAQGVMKHRCSQGASTATRENVLKELDNWKNGLPMHLQFLTIASPSTTISGGPRDPTATFEQLRVSLCRQTPHQIRALILLCIRYHYIVILVTRASLLHEIASQNKPNGPINPTIQSINSNLSPRTASPQCTTDGISTSSSSASMAVESASQICSLTLLLHSFSLLNGTSGLDVFYAYSAAMVLLLRILWVRGPSGESDDIEEESKKEIKGMVEELRKTVRQVDKSRTMKRFAVVMDKFASVIGSIGKNSNSSHVTDTVHTSHGARRTSTAETGFDNMQPSMPGHPRTIPAMANPQGLLQTTISPGSMPNSGFAQQSGWSPHLSKYTNIPLQTSQSARAPTPLLPSPAPPSQYPMYPTSSVQPGLYGVPGPGAFGSQDVVVGYEDPLDALANGYIIDWNDLDAFMEGI